MSHTSSTERAKRQFAEVPGKTSGQKTLAMLFPSPLAEESSELVKLSL
jgi:hypothetical protein